MPVWCSEPLDFTAGWRCFVRYGDVADVRHYKCAWDKAPARETLLAAVRDFQSAPVAYGLDSKVRPLLVEANDGHSLGCYGLEPVSYARLLSARWAELSHAENAACF